MGQGILIVKTIQPGDYPQVQGLLVGHSATRRAIATSAQGARSVCRRYAMRVDLSRDDSAQRHIRALKGARGDFMHSATLRRRFLRLPGPLRDIG